MPKRKDPAVTETEESSKCCKSADQQINTHEEMAAYNEHVSEHSSTQAFTQSIANGFVDNAVLFNQKKTMEGEQKLNPAEAMMARMGFQQGRGLGKHGQGIIDPIESSAQRGRRGLGFSVPGLEPKKDLVWDPSKENIEVREKVKWMPAIEKTDFDVREIHEKWCCLGPRKLNFDNETNFCSQDLLYNVLESKSVFDNLSSREMVQARTRSNPFETIGRMFFQNRAALKMANMDAVFDFIFTDPKDEDGCSSVKVDENLYFADVCAAPGGFSEYILWKRKLLQKGFCDCKGFGFTLKSNDFLLEDFLASSPSYLEPHYGALNDGDIFKSENIESFRRFVIQQTNGRGVHFVMADGGFSVEGQNNIQEILSKQLYLCQATVALGILRKGGHFVCKLFDLYTKFSVGLIYILGCCFKCVAIHKPNTSRPANSERYVVCKWLKSDVEWAYEYLISVNKQLNEFQNSDQDVTELVPLELLQSNADFVNYMYRSNTELGERQILALDKIRIFCQDTNLSEPRQSQVKSESLQFWQIPDQYRRVPSRIKVEEKAFEMLGLFGIDIRSLLVPATSLDLFNLNQIHTPYDYNFIVLASKQKEYSRDRAFLISQGRNKCFSWNGVGEMRWEKVSTRVDLPVDTFVYAEFVQEYEQDFKTYTTCLHLIDGIILNGFPIANLPLHERHHYLRKFATSVNKSTLSREFAPVRCKTLYQLRDITKVFNYESLWDHGSSRYFNKDIPPNGSDEVIYKPAGILLLKVIKDPYMFGFSQSHKRLYYFHTETRAALFDAPKDAISTFPFTFATSLYWWWEQGVGIIKEDFRDKEKVHLDTISTYLEKKLLS